MANVTVNSHFLKTNLKEEFCSEIKKTNQKNKNRLRNEHLKISLSTFYPINLLKNL